MSEIVDVTRDHVNPDNLPALQFSSDPHPHEFQVDTSKTSNPYSSTFSGNTAGKRLSQQFVSSLRSTEVIEASTGSKPSSAPTQQEDSSSDEGDDGSSSKRGGGKDSASTRNNSSDALLNPFQSGHTGSTESMVTAGSPPPRASKEVHSMYRKSFSHAFDALHAALEQNLAMLRLRTFDLMEVTLSEEDMRTLLHKCSPATENVTSNAELAHHPWIIEGIHQTRRDMDSAFQVSLTDFRNRLLSARAGGNSTHTKTAAEYDRMLKTCETQMEKLRSTNDQLQREVISKETVITTLEGHLQATTNEADRCRQLYFEELLFLRQQIHMLQIRLSNITGTNQVDFPPQFIDWAEFPVDEETAQREETYKMMVLMQEQLQLEVTILRKSVSEKQMLSKMTDMELRSRTEECEVLRSQMEQLLLDQERVDQEMEQKVGGGTSGTGSGSGLGDKRVVNTIQQNQIRTLQQQNLQQTTQIQQQVAEMQKQQERISQLESEINILKMQSTIGRVSTMFSKSKGDLANTSELMSPLNPQPSVGFSQQQQQQQTPNKQPAQTPAPTPLPPPSSVVSPPLPPVMFTPVSSSLEETSAVGSFRLPTGSPRSQQPGSPRTKPNVSFEPQPSSPRIPTVESMIISGDGGQSTTVEPSHHPHSNVQARTFARKADHYVPKEEHDALKESFAALEAQMIELAEKSKNREIELLKQLQESKSALPDLEDKYRALEIEYKLYKEQSTMEHDNVCHEMGAMATEMESLRARLDQSRETILNLQAEIDHLKEMNKTGTQTATQLLEAEKRKNQIFVQELELEIQRVQKEKDALNTKIVNLTKERDRLVAINKGAQANSDEQAVVKLRLELEALRMTKEDLIARARQVRIVQKKLINDFQSFLSHHRKCDVTLAAHLDQEKRRMYSSSPNSNDTTGITPSATGTTPSPSPAQQQQETVASLVASLEHVSMMTGQNPGEALVGLGWELAQHGLANTFDVNASILPGLDALRHIRNMRRHEIAGLKDRQRPQEDHFDIESHITSDFPGIECAVQFLDMFEVFEVLKFRMLDLLATCVRGHEMPDDDVHGQRNLLLERFSIFRTIEALCTAMTHKLGVKKENILREREEALETVLGELGNIAKTHPREVQKALRIVQSTHVIPSTTVTVQPKEVRPLVRPQSSMSTREHHQRGGVYQRVSSAQPSNVSIVGKQARLQTPTKCKGL
eukprot:PhF_6_TR13380/c0_g1_i1/m.21244